MLLSLFFWKSPELMFWIATKLWGSICKQTWNSQTDAFFLPSVWMFSSFVIRKKGQVCTRLYFIRPTCTRVWKRKTPRKQETKWMVSKSSFKSRVAKFLRGFTDPFSVELNKFLGRFSLEPIGLQYAPGSISGLHQQFPYHLHCEPAVWRLWDLSKGCGRSDPWKRLVDIYLHRYEGGLIRSRRSCLMGESTKLPGLDHGF